MLKYRAAYAKITMYAAEHGGMEGGVPLNELTPVYKRVLLKVSGEALAGGAGRGLDFEFLHRLGAVLRRCVDLGVQVGMVSGGGNFWRGVKDGGGRMERSRADQIGMLATVMNSLALAEALEQENVPVRVMTMVDMPRIAESYNYGRAMHHLEKGRVVLFTGGTGNPWFSTDSGAALKAAEIGADVVLMAKNIDGVYTGDPKTDPTAVRLEETTNEELLEKHLKVIDAAAAALLQDSGIPLMVFSLDPPENILRVICGEKIGTLVK